MARFGGLRNPQGVEWRVLEVCGTRRVWNGAFWGSAESAGYGMAHFGGLGVPTGCKMVRFRGLGVPENLDLQR